MDIQSIMSPDQRGSTTQGRCTILVMNLYSVCLLFGAPIQRVDGDMEQCLPDACSFHCNTTT